MLKQKIVLDYGSKIVLNLMGSFAGIFVARIAGPTIIGTVAFGVSYIGILGFINGFFGTSHIKLLSEGEDQASCNGTYFVLKVITSTILVISVLIMYYFQTSIFKMEFESADHIKVVFITLASIVVQSLFNDLMELNFVAYMQQAKLNIPHLIQTLIYSISRIIVVIIGFGAVALSYVNLFSTVLLCFLFYYFFRGYKIGRFDKKLLSKYFLIGVPVFVVVVSNSLLKHFGRLILQFFNSSTDLGYYTAGDSIAGFFMMAAASSGSIFFPLFSKLSSSGKLDKIEGILWTYEKFVWVFMMPIIFLFSIMSFPIITLILGNKYALSAGILKILTISSFIAILGMPFGNILSGLGKFKMLAYMNIINLILFIAVLLILVHPSLFNLRGLALAYAYLISYIYLYFYRFLFSKKFIKLNLFKKTTPFIIISIVFLITGNYFFPILYKILNYHSLYIFPIIFLSLIFLIFILFKLITKNDFAQLKTVLNMNNTINYIKTEIKSPNED